ncbi:LANO_0E01662g1_1 [Lachancea nothofagi CBS 11611]|uniref:LANO_0E01662g1_1 n=1 Tax=Lachancea nothofagi CBS 11611 TaxID=1266666 RepID=A0A1G4JPI6_9SACH|nr:LANO_0E01662g1_1 [Lachancea nothofagi CBS 11611]
MSGTGRLPGLNQGAAKPGLKFKPKALARRSKEEREKAIPKPATEDVLNGHNSRKKYSKKDFGKNGQQQKRVPKYLLNTRVVGAGFGAENFAGGGSDMRRGFMKSEGGSASHDLLQRGLQQANSGDKSAEDADSDNEGQTKFNMGREYRANELYASEDEVDVEGTEPDEEVLRSKRLAHFFPVRAVRVRHEDIDTMEKELKDTMSDLNTREPTPGVVMKQEEDISNVIDEREAELQEKLNDLQLQNESALLDSTDAVDEARWIAHDHAHIHNRLLKINNKPGKFMFFQLPAVLPDFETPPEPAEEKSMHLDPTESTDPTEPTDPTETASMSTEVKSTSDVEADSKPLEKAPSKAAEASAQEVLDRPLAGNIGALRIHKSGKITVKIGNVVMDINRGAENTFLQEVVALDERDDERTVELLGRITGKVVVTPKF